MEAYIQAWKLGLKAVAIYRDGSKKAQPLSSMGSATAKSQKGDAIAAAEVVDEGAAPPRAIRHRLPDERLSITHKFNVGGTRGTSLSDSTRTACRARSSSPWPRKARPSAG